MQHRFSGDIGDYGKYGLLRVLGTPPLILAVIWYLVDSPNTPPSARTTRYLSNPAWFRPCDPPLFDALNRLVGNSDRSIYHIQSAEILPPGTIYYQQYLPSSGGSSLLKERRVAWLEDALATTAPCDLVFLDPDNGIAPSGLTQGSRKGYAYVFPKEIPPFLARGQSLIIYHHLSRRWNAASQISLLFKRLSDLTDSPPFALRFHRGGSRIFIILPSVAHRSLLENRAEHLVHRSPWAEHFTLVRE